MDRGIKVEARKNLSKYVVPMVLSNCCFFLFTVVDGVISGNGVGPDALGAINLAMPFVMTVQALFMLVSIGGVTIGAIRFGKNDIDGANSAFRHACVLMLAVAAILSLVGVCFTDSLVKALGANETYRQMVTDYLSVYSVFLVPSGCSVCLQNFCRNDGSPKLVSLAVILSSCLNIFLVWLFVFPFRYGVAGSALATGISECFAFFIVLSHFLRKKGELRFGSFTLHAQQFRDILKCGSPEMVAQFATPVTTLCMNYMLINGIGDAAVNAFSVMSYMTTISVAIFFGVSDGLQPLMGRSHGAQDTESLAYYFKSGRIINLVLSILIFIILLFVDRPLCALFNADEATRAIIAVVMPIYAWCFIVISQNTIISSYFYSTRHTYEALIMNVGRALLFNSASILLLPQVLGYACVWFAPGVAELVTLAVATLLLKRLQKRGVLIPQRNRSK